MSRSGSALASAFGFLEAVFGMSLLMVAHVWPQCSTDNDRWDRSVRDQRPTSMHTGRLSCRDARLARIRRSIRGNPMADPTEKSQHILVVNDTEEILDLFRDIIESLGHRMTAWSFSPDDLAKVTEILPDLIILDLMVGPTELQGWALLQKLRMSPPTEDIPVIVCTAATNWVREQDGWLPTRSRSSSGRSR